MASYKACVKPRAKRLTFLLTSDATECRIYASAGTFTYDPSNRIKLIQQRAKGSRLWTL